MIAETRGATQASDFLAASNQRAAPPPPSEGFEEAMREACPETVAPTGVEMERAANPEVEAKSSPDATEAPASTEQEGTPPGSVTPPNSEKHTGHGARSTTHTGRGPATSRKGSERLGATGNAATATSSAPAAAAAPEQGVPSSAVPLAKTNAPEAGRVPEASPDGRVAVQDGKTPVAASGVCDQHAAQTDVGADSASSSMALVPELASTPTEHAFPPADAGVGSHLLTESSAVGSATAQALEAPRATGVNSPPQPALGLPAAHTEADWSVQRYEAPTANRLEVGVAGGAFGWLSVRAEVNATGDVHAYLRGSSAGAQVELQAQTTALQSFLGTQELKVHAVHVEASQPAAAWKSGAGGGDAQQRSAKDGTAEDGKGEGARHGGTMPMTEQLPILQSGSLPRLGSGGGWLSVMA